MFQAEDGKRDIGVTGVQACALPIAARLCYHGIGQSVDSSRRSAVKPSVVLRITEIFLSVQGESTHAGRPCALVRLTGDRKSVVQGKSADLAGRLILKKKKVRG